MAATVRREYQNEMDEAMLLAALGTLWRAGVDVDWDKLRGDSPRKTGLPATAMDERRFYIAEGMTVLGPSVGEGPEPRPVDEETAETVRADASHRVETVRLSGLAKGLAGLWEEILGTPNLGPSDDFFDLGGDSMMSIRLLAGLERLVGTRVPAVVVFEAATLQGMADHITAWQIQHGGQDD